MNINRILTGAMCAIAILSASGCPRRVPTEPEPPTPAPVVEPGPTDPAKPAPGPTDPVAPAPGPTNPVAPAPGPNPNPVVTPPPAPVATPTPAPKVTPKPTPEPTDEPEPEPTDEQIFAELIREKMGHFRVDRAINEMRSQMFLRADGWSKGQFETPEEYSTNMFDEVKYTFRNYGKYKSKDITYEEFLSAAENFSVDSLIASQHIYYVDLKRSTAGNQEFYILRYSPDTKEVIGVKTGTSDYIPNLPTASNVGSQFNRLSNGRGKVFFYALERRTNFLDNEQRFIRIPQMFFSKNWLDLYQSQAVEQQRVHQQRVYQQRVAQQQFNAQRRAPVYTNTGYPQQSGY